MTPGSDEPRPVRRRYGPARGEPRTPYTSPMGADVRRILIVDDDPDVRRVHAKLVQGIGHEAETAADGFEALAKLVLGIDLVLLDLQMPSMDGFEVARRIRAMPEYAMLPIIMVTGRDGSGEHRTAMEVGVNDFISKPINAEELALRSRWLLELKHAYDRLNKENVELDHLVRRRTDELREALEEMSETKRRIYDAHLDTIRRLTIASELKDEDTAGHIERIGRYAEVLAENADLPPNTVETIRHAAPMHDVGKLGVPDAILLKPGKLNGEEWVAMQAHASLGAELLAGSDSPVIRMGERIARCHHERWDGTGYPDGLAGEDIPLEARICAVVDFFDATTMDRPYRRALPVAHVLDLMSEGSGTHFDPGILDVFFKCLPGIMDVRADHVIE